MFIDFTAMITEWNSSKFGVLCGSIYFSDEISRDHYYRSHKVVDNFCVLRDFITLTDRFQLYHLYWTPPNLRTNSLGNYNNIIRLVYSI